MMERAVLFSLLAAAACAAFAQEPPSQPQEAIPCYRTAKPVVIDGVLDDPCWNSAVVLKADYIFGKKGQQAPSAPMTMRCAWDESYLYIAYETFDKNLVAVWNGAVQGPLDNRREGAMIWHDVWKIDVAEFFISFGDKRFFWETHHNALNQFNDVWITVTDPSWPLDKGTMSIYGFVFCHEEYIRDDPPCKLQMAVKLKPKADGTPSTVNDPMDEDTGYTAEIRFPWFGIGVPRDRAVTRIEEPPAGSTRLPKAVRAPGLWKMEGQEMWLLGVVQNADEKDRYHHTSPTLGGGWFHSQVSEWPHFRMVAAEGPPPLK